MNASCAKLVFAVYDHKQGMSRVARGSLHGVRRSASRTWPDPSRRYGLKQSSPFLCLDLAATLAGGNPSLRMITYMLYGSTTVPLQLLPERMSSKFLRSVPFVITARIPKRSASPAATGSKGLLRPGDHLDPNIFRNSFQLMDGIGLAEREAARQRQDWDTADRIRAELEEAGIEVIDTPAGPRWHRR